MKNYKQTASDVLRLVGGEKNVVQVEHCSTRLRFTLADTSKADVAALKKTAGVMGVIGHNFPVWLKFRGGKGVASAFGFIVVTQWQLGVIALCVWLVTAFTTRYSSLSAILAAVSVPFFAFFMSDPVHAAFYSAIALLVLIRHHANIARLIKGTESKISFKKKA